MCYINNTKGAMKLKAKDHIYFIRIGAPEDNLYKIGTTNDIARRMYQHERYYKKPVEVIWVSPAYSKYTTLRVEDRTINAWKELDGFNYIRNDRFIIDPSIHQITIKVKKEWMIEF